MTPKLKSSKKPKTRAPLEKHIQASILRWLGSTSLLHWRQNAGVLKHGRFQVRLGPKGAPDIVVVVPPIGTFLGLEVKRKGTYQNSDQKEFQRQLETSGGMYFVVRSLEEAKEAVSKCLQRVTVLSDFTSGPESTK